MGFFQDDTGLLTLVASNFCIIAIVVLVYIVPYKRKSDNLFALISLLLLSFCVQYSLIEETGIKGIFSSAILILLYIEFTVFLLFVGVDLSCLVKARMSERNILGTGGWIYRKTEKPKKNKTMEEITADYKRASSRSTPSLCAERITISI